MSSGAEPSWLAEPPIGGFQQRAEITNTIYEGSSPFQTIAVYDTVPFGRALVLDRAVQTTVRDEFIYHEMLVHPALVAHGKPRQVLIIGGGDGGTLRRVLEHDVEQAIMVEIDRAVVDVCLRDLPEIAGDAFQDRRSQLLIGDGTRFVAEAEGRFDVVLVDSTDPVGPAKALFDVEFYRNVARALRPGGLLVTQSGSPLLMREELRHAVASLRQIFPFVRCYLANIPSYPGCLWSFLIAGGDYVSGYFSPESGSRFRATVERRAARSDLQTSYYTPAVHFASLALPPFISRDLPLGASA